MIKFIDGVVTSVSFIVLIAGAMLVVIGFITMLGLDLVHAANEVLHNKIDVVQTSCMQMVVGAIVAFIGARIKGRTE